MVYWGKVRKYNSTKLMKIRSFKLYIEEYPMVHRQVLPGYFEPLELLMLNRFQCTQELVPWFLWERNRFLTVLNSLASKCSFPLAATTFRLATCSDALKYLFTFLWRQHLITRLSYWKCIFTFHAIKSFNECNSPAVQGFHCASPRRPSH